MKKQNKNLPNKKNYLILVFILAVLLPLLIIYLLKPGKDLPEKKIENKQMDFFKKEGELTFISKQDVLIKKIDIEIADDDAQRQLGLMFRPYMNENQGMLFIFPQIQPLSFWMKNTMIPLDMFFVDENMNIITIHKNTIPYSEQSYAAKSVGKYVVETIAGFADKYNIKEGDKIYFTRL